MTARLIHRGPPLVAVLVSVAMFTLAPGVASASGGGGCGQAVTDRAAMTVEIQSFCFGPTITRVKVGSDVTFRNLDPVPHTVLGANGSWGGYDAVKKNRAVTYRFSEAGVFPYVCTFHPGMVGVVVVGGGIGGAIGTTTKDGPVTKVLESSPAAHVAVAAAPSDDAGTGRSTVMAFAALGLILVIGSSIVVARRRRRSVA